MIAKHFSRVPVAGALVFLAAIMATTSAQAADNVTRHGIPGSDFPIAQGVEVHADATVLYLSGTVPPVVDDSADPHTTAAYGDMETQTRNILKSISKKLDNLGYDMGDVVKMHAYLAPDPDMGHVDFKGFMKAYTEFFGTDDQPNLPARTSVGVPQMVNPGWLVEIEVTAAK